MVNYATYDIETEILKDGLGSCIAGVDEVGRGSLAGCVLAAAVRVPTEIIPQLLYEVKDSKKLSAKKREQLYPLIMSTCDVGFGVVSNETIDKINILEATKLAMHEAILNLKKVDYVLIDGTVKIKDLTIPQKQIIKGDTLSISIAAASIVAKVLRDRIMLDLHDEYPMYEFDKNMGYGTKKHMFMIQDIGPCPYHRVTFGGVKEWTPVSDFLLQLI